MQILLNIRSIAADLGRDLRVMSLILRMAAIIAAIVLIFTSSGRGLTYFVPALGLYLTGIAVLSALSAWRRDPARYQTAWVLLDAGFVTAILYEHILGAPILQPHGLTTASLVIPFLFLSHVGMGLRGRLIFLFSATVLAGWLGMLALMAWRHEWLAPGSFR